MKRVPRDNPELDFLRLMSRSGSFKRISRYTDKAVRAFGADLAGLAGKVVSQEQRVAGIRAESVFQAVVAGIGDVLLLKEEDEGDVFFDGDDVAVPDIRIVLHDGQNLLVEVKRLRFHLDPSRRFSIADARVQALKRYSDLVGGDFYFALFWEDIGIWTLNSLEAMEAGKAGKRSWSICYERAFVTSEMNRLGDCMIATAPPIRFRILVDGEKSEPMPQKDGEANIVVAGVQLLSQDRVLFGLARRIGWILMRFGDWEEWEPEFKEKNGKLIHIDYPVGPPDIDEVAHPQVPMIGSLSKIISRCYLEGARNTVHTTSSSEVLEPGFMGQRLIPRDWVERNLDIPIGKFFVQPNFDPKVLSGLGRERVDT